MSTDDRRPDENLAEDTATPTETTGTQTARTATPDAGAGPDRRKDPLRGSRAGSTWVTLVGVGVLLVLLVIFILQNTQSVRVSFLGFDGTAPLAVCLLIAAAAGILITALAGTLRILQLRHRVRRETRRARR